MKLARVVFFVIAGCYASVILNAQEVRATVGGRVTDQQGGVVPAATVLVVSDESGVKQQTSTNAQGNLIVQFLLPGHYKVTVSAAGFKALERSGVVLQAGDNKQ